MLARRERLRLVGATVIVTSLAWIAGLALYLIQAEPPRQPVEVAGSPPAPTSQFRSVIAPQPSRRLPPGRLAIPVAGITAAALSDTFTQARAGGARRHDAIDITAPRGTPVLAAAAGRVERLFLSRDGGNTVYIRSPDRRLLYYYAHLDSYAPGLAEGQAVAPGSLLGTVGISGNADPAAPHLHFAVLETQPDAPWYAEGIPINPYPLLTR